MVPKGDPTVLFNTAGMHPLVPYLMGEPHPEGKRLVDYQKCVRTNDIDEVGDATHLTFFEMLGNWSLGDYFKKEAIEWSFEFLTSPEWLGIPVEKLAISVFQGDEDAPKDEEAADLWRSHGIQDHKIVYLAKVDNWWGPAGETGPCGPDTEMFYYLPDGTPPEESNPENDSKNWMEIWNDVFMQYNKTPDGNYVPLTAQNVDTGMGLERIVTVLQGKKNVYDTDLFRPMIDLILGLTDADYEGNQASQRAIRIIADHVRAATFIVGDGVVPSNVHRGYVLRRLIRRAIAQAHLLGYEETILGPLVTQVIEQYGDAYKELKEGKARILATLEQEEQAFRKTLARGLRELQKMLDETPNSLTEKQHHKLSLESKVEITAELSLSGTQTFLLHDTYGFPIDLTVEFARGKNIAIDRVEFEKELQKQQDRSRVGSGFTLGKSLEEMYAEEPKTSFTGYEHLSDQATVLRIYQQDDQVQVILDKTPFYGESGGQTGDRGQIVGISGTVTVTTTKKTKRDVFVHIGTLEGTMAEGETVEANVDVESREQIMRYHTGTHLLHKALRDVLGFHVLQKGSSITEKRLRFDFSHDAPLSSEQIAEVESKINAWVDQDLAVKVIQTTLDKAKAEGAMALFEGKYDLDVRLVQIGGDVSKELCGGTHVTHTGEIDHLQIDKQESVGGGVRRVRVR